ncbi:small acid-soluble spore protein E (minor gamma-type SASP) [Bacillus niacini]|uniref:Small, acid-soluble spore protein gamma-type n=1 Tax=Neobacillus niacini TaxID=86668 RepID=A0A852THS1_9BACI|nr:gamma-type small acid-soluble spore protein [Neobacillus niacini]MDQ0973269.1 small acid-soluble spore protein E (minor gamma-type SASP) [Neobacillus niacini]NYE08302.1 small acid-soluble spore protein E (minor gamma-type SASP) [Neobacillus niacini]
MANNFNQQPNKTSAGTNIQEVRQQNAQSQGQGSAGQFGTEFASQTDAAEVRRQNQQSQSGQGSAGTAGATGSAGQFGTEFASQTDAAEVRRQNQQSQANKGQGNSGQFGQS